MGKTFDNPLENYKRQQAEAAAIRAEIARQEATPLGQKQLEIDRLQAQFDQQERQRGAQAMAEAKKIQADNPTLRTETALIMAESRITNRNGGQLTFDDVKRWSETMTSGQITKKIAEEFKDSPSGLLMAHGWAERAQRLKKANSRHPELRAKVAEILKTNPSMDLHAAYRRAGTALGII